jgi:hypothetical protein
LTARYTARAVHECDGSLRALRHSIAEQIRIASATIAMIDTLERLCDCSRVVPHDPLQHFTHVRNGQLCPPCKTKLGLIFVAMRPAAHTTDQHQFALEMASNALRASGHLT